MLNKTPDFDLKFNTDINEIAINRKRPFRHKGSYKVKEYGEPITDIDLETLVYLDRKLLDIVSAVIRRLRNSKHFIFLRMSCGHRIEFKVPWTVGDEGGCDFSLKIARKWLKQLNVPESVKKQIHDKLYSSTIRIRDLIEIENLLSPFSNIEWQEPDIQRGFREINGIRYELLDVMKTETPVLEYVYVYGIEIVSVDVGLVDPRYKFHAQNMPSFYTEDWYKILKSYRWKLEEKYKKEYFEVMKKVTKAVVLKYQIDLLKRVQGSNVPKNIIENLLKEVKERLHKMGMKYHKNISEEIYTKTNNYLSKYVEYFYKKLEPRFQKVYLLYLKRGIDAQIPVTHDEILKREKQGMKCPFFTTDISEYDKLITLSVKIDMEPETVVKCFLQVAEQMGVSVKELIAEAIPTENDFYVKGNEVFNNGKLLGNFSEDKKKAIQTLLLTKPV